MPSCREIDPLFAPYIDGAATPDERAIVDAHLRACPKCRHQTALQAAVRETVRTRLCRPCAPEALRERCLAAAQAHAGPFATLRRTLTTLSIAALVVLTAGGVLLYSLTGLSPTVLAAQLTLDHVTCFAVHDSFAPVDARASEAQYSRAYGQQIRLPQTTIAGLQLVGVRRCYCGEGAAAHIMYRLNGRPVSLYMIPDATHSRATSDVFGHDAVIWSKHGTTYVLVSREDRATLEQLAFALDASL
jgi:anti-sigma factor RsiW